MVQFDVRRLRNYFQVVRGVVPFIAVIMVDDFTGLKRPTKLLGSNPSVLVLATFLDV